MKKILLTLVLLIGIVVGLFAQKLTYQAVIRDNNQQLVVNTAVKATVTITFTTGVPYAEEVNGSTNIHGLLSFEFGDETLAGRDWTGANIAVKVVNAATPSTVYVNDEARPVSAVPYALNVNGQSIQNYLTEHNYVDETELDSRHYLTSDSTVITTMQGNIANLTQHTTKSAIRDSVAGQIHDSIADIAAKSHTHGNKDLLDTYNQTNADLADAVAKKHAHDNAAVLAATTAPYTDADSIKLKGIAEGAEVNVQADWNQNTTTADDYIKNKPTIPAAANNATLTIQKNGTSVGTFTADASSDKSINITVPTTTSELTNNSGFITTANVPTNVSQLNNDAGYLTNADLTTLLSAINGKIDSLAHLVDSLSNLTPGGEPTATFTCGSSKVKDVDNNEYNTVKIGSQCWMAQNLRTSTNTASTGNIYTPTTSEEPGYDVETYGRLYDWAAVMQGASSSDAVPSGVQGICPTGWHVPSDAEWTQLTTYVGSQSEYVCGSDNTNIAKALASTTGWSSNTNEGCNAGNRGDKANATGFSAVPAGNCFYGDFSGFGGLAYVWSATQYDDYDAWRRILASSFSNVLSFNASKDFGSSVRCLRDAETGGGDTPSAPAMMSCEQVMECMGDTLGQLNAKIEAQGAEIETLNGTVTTQGNTIDSLAHLVDSLSNLTPGGEPTATFTCGTSKVKDADGNEYNTVAIGNQCWMAQNLRTKIGGDGDKGYPTGAGNDTVTYGRLYTWNAMMKGAPSTNYPAGTTEADTIVHGICPAGWHVPSDAEWTALTDYVNTEANGYRCNGDGTIAKALSQPTGWSSNTNEGCNAGNRGDKANATGFSAVPAGGCFSGDFYNFGNIAYFWSATQSDGDGAWCHYLGSLDSGVGSSQASKDYGFSVRCLRDAETGGGDTPSAPAMMSCEQVMQCMGDTLGRLNAKIEAQGNTIDTLANLVDSLAKLVPGGEPTATFTCGSSKVKDVDSNEYNTVAVGNQCWLKENLRTKTHQYGTVWTKTDVDSTIYGRYYDWQAAMQIDVDNNTLYSGSDVKHQGICPEGWHVPSYEEWDTLTTYVNTEANGYRCDGDGTIAKALSRPTGWSSNTGTGCNAGNTGDKANATGFAAVPAGYCFFGDFYSFGYYAYFWSATQDDGYNAGYWRLRSDNSFVASGNGGKDYGFSVRCLRD